MKGTHYLVDIHSCDEKILDDVEYLSKLLEAAAELSGATVLQTRSHKFEPQGVTAFCLLSESHISIHTWPEEKTAAIDMFTCGTCDPQLGTDLIIDALGGALTTYSVIQRCREPLTLTNSIE